jgi:N-acetylneuraminate synthase
MHMGELRIGDRLVGHDYLPFVVAEVGINHEGEIDKAIQMVDAAVQAGADCVKFQCHITEAEMIPTDMRPGEISDESLWDIIKRCELTEGEERREAADRLNDMGVFAFKVGSGECNNLPLLDHIAAFGKPIILSTGMNDLASISESVKTIQKHDVPFMLMHCTSMYPTPYEKVRLGAIPQLIKEFGLPVGLSDHSMGVYTCFGAVALGACALEKHFTISRSWPGPDTSISIEPKELEELVKGSRAIFAARGGTKGILSEEQPVIEFAYASVVTIKPIGKGEEFSLRNTWVKRPGTGPILAKDLDSVLGRVASRNLPVDVQVSPEDYE